MSSGNGSDRALARAPPLPTQPAFTLTRFLRRPPRTRCRIGAECQRPVAVLAHLVGRQTGVSKKGPTGIERAGPGKVGWVAQTLSCILLHRPWLTAVVAVGSIDLPASHQAPQQARLLMPEWQIVNPQQTKNVREVIVANRALRLGDIKRVLCKRKKCARIGREGFRGVINRLTEGVGRFPSEPVPILQPELTLQTMVNRVARVRVFGYPAEIAVRVPHRISELVCRQRQIRSLEATTRQRGLVHGVRPAGITLLKPFAINGARSGFPFTSWN